jgi:hypothetical protein
MLIPGTGGAISPLSPLFLAAIRLTPRGGSGLPSSGPRDGLLDFDTDVDNDPVGITTFCLSATDGRRGLTPGPGSEGRLAGAFSLALLIMRSELDFGNVCDRFSKAMGLSTDMEVDSAAGGGPNPPYPLVLSSRGGRGLPLALLLEEALASEGLCAWPLAVSDPDVPGQFLLLPPVNER